MRPFRTKAAAGIILLGLIVAACGTRVTDGGATSAGGSVEEQTASRSGVDSASGTGSGGAVGGGSEGSAGDAGGAGQATVGSGGGAGGASNGDGGGTVTAQGGGDVDCSQAEATDTGVTEDKIVFGLDATLSGLLATLGRETQGGFNAYIQRTNAEGGVHCRQIEIITYDNRFDANQSKANIQRLVDQDGAFAVFTFTGDESMDFVTNRGVPMLVYGVTPFGFSSHFPTVFPIVGNALLWQQDLVYLANEYFDMAPERVGIIYDNETWDMRPYLDGFRESWERLGAEVVTEDPWTLSGGDCTELVLKWRQNDVQFVDLDTPGFTSCVSAAERQQWKPEVGWGGWPASTVLTFELMGESAYWADGIIGGSLADLPDGSPGSRVEGEWGGTEVPPNNVGVYPELEGYLDSVRRYSPRLDDPARLESPVTTGWYIIAQLAVHALEQCGIDLTRECFVETLQGTSDFDTGIAAPISSFSQDCKTGSEYVWAAAWEYDEGPHRTPDTPWATSPWKDELGGECFLTEMADDFVR